MYATFIPTLISFIPVRRLVNYVGLNMYMYIPNSFGFVVAEGIGVACGGEEVACGTAVPISEGVVGFENNVFLLVKLLLMLAPCFLSVSLSTSSLSNTSHIVSRH